MEVCCWAATVDGRGQAAYDGSVIVEHNCSAGLRGHDSNMDKRVLSKALRQMKWSNPCGRKAPSVCVRSRRRCKLVDQDNDFGWCILIAARSACGPSCEGTEALGSTQARLPSSCACRRCYDAMLSSNRFRSIIDHGTSCNVGLMHAARLRMRSPPASWCASCKGRLGGSRVPCSTAAVKAAHLRQATGDAAPACASVCLPCYGPPIELL